MDDTLLTTEDATDEGRFPKLKNEVLRGLVPPPAALWKETMEMGRDDTGPLGERGGTRVLAAEENGRVIVPLAMW
jgi:hypothetical protein